MRAGNRNDRRPSESPDNRERVTSGGGDKHVLASFLDLHNRVRRIERTVIHDNRSSRSATYTSRAARDRKSTRLNSSQEYASHIPSSACTKKDNTHIDNTDNHNK